MIGNKNDIVIDKNPMSSACSAYSCSLKRQKDDKEVHQNKGNQNIYVFVLVYNQDVSFLG